MRLRTHLAGGLVLVSAAFLAVLITAHPANRGVLAALVRQGAPENGYCGDEYYGDCGRVFNRDFYNSGYNSGGYNSGGYNGAGPTLQLSPNWAVPGDRVTVTGAGFTQCTDESNDTWVQLSVAGNTAVANGSAGSFSKTFTVPASAAAGTYTLGAACYSPLRRVVTSSVLKTAQLTVGSRGGSSPPPSAGPPGQPSSGSNGALIGTVSGAAGGAGLAFLAFLWMRASRRKHDGRWVKEHLRALAVPSSGPPSAEIRPRPGARSVSLGLQPHGGIAGIARIEEVGP